MIRSRPLSFFVSLLLAVPVLLAGCGSADTATAPKSPSGVAPVVQVYKSPTCGCCNKWVEHLRASGFTVETHDQAAVNPLKTQLGVPQELWSCHTAIVDGYAIEGHVPAQDIRRLLAERPQARGIAVPGMPIGSPGMEVGDRVDPYEVLLFGQDGEPQVYARHGF